MTKERRKKKTSDVPFQTFRFLWYLNAAKSLVLYVNYVACASPTYWRLFSGVGSMKITRRRRCGATFLLRSAGARTICRQREDPETLTLFQAVREKILLISAAVSYRAKNGKQYTRCLVCWKPGCLKRTPIFAVPRDIQQGLASGKRVS